MLRSWNLSPVGTSAWVEIRRPHFSWDQGDLQDHTCTEKISGGQERERLPAHNTFCQLPQNLHSGIQIGWKVCVYIREGPESDQIWATSKMIGQKEPRRWPPYKQLLELLVPSLVYCKYAVFSCLARMTLYILLFRSWIWHKFSPVRKSLIYLIHTQKTAPI